MMLKGCLFIGFFIAVGCLIPTKCYHKKCETHKYIYTDCDQEYYRCDKYDYDDSDTIKWPGKCVYTGFASSYGSYVECYEDKKCTTDWIDGQAKCVFDYDDYPYTTDTTDFYEDGITTAVTIVIIIVCVTFGIIVTFCICCFCLGKGCFKNRAANQGRVINTPPATTVTYNQTAGVVQTATTHPPGQGSKQPATQYPPTQYPPAQYPPGGQYPPAAGGYPPAQYPPTQYPPAAGGYPPGQYPPTQYPPAGGYPPAQYPPAPAGPGGEYNPPPPPPAGHPPPPGDTHPAPVGGSSEPSPPPSYQSAVEPAENPYVEAFRG